MNYCQHDYLEFVPGKLISECDRDDVILVFTLRQKNSNKLCKRKKTFIGRMFKHDKTRKWCFSGLDDRCYCSETMMIIARFCHLLDKRMILFDMKKGELRNNGI